MPNINEWLARKYAILGQNADADTERARASTMSAMASQDQAQAALQDAASMAGLRGAQAGYVGEQARYFGPTAESEIKLRKAQGGKLGSETRALNFTTDTTQDLLRRTPDLGFSSMLGLPGIGLTDQTSLYNKRLGLRKGTAKVVDKTGNGSPYEDTVPAKLAHGEAVLNAGAAEVLGRDIIENLNNHGLRMMGKSGKGSGAGYTVSNGVLHAADGYNPFTIPLGEEPAYQPFKIQGTAAPVNPRQVFMSQLKSDANLLNKIAPSAETVQKAANVTGAGLRGVAKVAKPLALGYEVVDTATDVMNPNVSWPLKAGRIAEGVAKSGLGLLGSAAGGTAGVFTGPAAPVAVPALGLAGGYEGYNLPGQVMHAMGMKLPSEQIAEINAKRQAAPTAAPQAAMTAEQIANKNAGIIRQTQAEIEAANKGAQVQDNLVRMALAGNAGAQKILGDQMDVMKSRAAGGVRGGAEGTIFSPMTDKQGNTVMKKDEEKTALFNEMFLPEYARSMGTTAEKLTKQDIRNAKVNYNLMEAANRAAREAGNGFQFNSPLMGSQMQYVPDLPILTGGVRGSNTMWQGLKDNLWGQSGGVVVRNAGGQQQTVPMEYLNMADPDVYAAVKELMNQSK